jgi:amino acid permease
MSIVTGSSVLITSTLYTLCAVFGYLTFYGYTEDNILKNYKNDNISAMIAKIAICFSIIGSFPIVLSSVRTSINLIFYKDKEFSWERHIIIALIIIIFTFTMGTIFPSISIIFGLLGSSFAIFLMFLFPSFMIIKLLFFKKDSWRINFNFSLILIIFPIIFILISFVFGKIYFIY